MLEGFTPWPAELAARYRQRGYWRDQPLGDIVDRGAELFGERVALISGIQSITYLDLKRRVDRLALHLLRLGMRPGDRIVVHLNNTPDFVYLYYACAKTSVLPVMALLPHRFAEIRYLADFSGAMAYAVPALAIRWLDAFERERCDLSSLQVLQVGGAKLNSEPARRVGPTLGCQLQQVFGMAEGLLNYTRLDDPEEEIDTTQGRPCSADDEIRIVDEEGRDVQAGEPGELLARGPYTIRGYYNAPEHNQRAFSPDGYYRSGDIVRLSPRGNLIVEGRAKDLINRGGEKISAEEIENLVLAHPSVFNAAVVAMPDPVLGERTCVYVILRAGTRLTLQELVAFLQVQQIAKFKLPERLEVVENFPLTNVGKVSKKDLREDIARKLGVDRAAAASATILQPQV